MDSKTIEILEITTDLIPSDPHLALNGPLRGPKGGKGDFQGKFMALVLNNPWDAHFQATYLAALYFANPSHFKIAFRRTIRSGVTGKDLIAIPSFRSAMQKEKDLVKAGRSGVLPGGVQASLLSLL